MLFGDTECKLGTRSICILCDLKFAQSLWQRKSNAFFHAPEFESFSRWIDRWEIETTFEELKTHLHGRQMLLGSKTPELIRQEFWGILLAHFAVPGLMHEAALKAELDPDLLYFIHTVRAIRSTSRLAPLRPFPCG